MSAVPGFGTNVPRRAQNVMASETLDMTLPVDVIPPGNGIGDFNGRSAKAGPNAE